MGEGGSRGFDSASSGEKCILYVYFCSVTTCSSLCILAEKCFLVKISFVSNHSCHGSLIVP